MIVEHNKVGFKWCPHARVATMNGKTAVNRDGEHPDALPDGAVHSENQCIGSECMAWRWAKVQNPNWSFRKTMHLANPPSPDDVKHPAEVPQAYIDSETHGYCGLAGAP